MNTAYNPFYIIKNVIAGICLISCSLLPVSAKAQDANIYEPAANAEKDIAAMVKRAKAENKHVLIQAGGNWCTWCIKFHKLSTTDPQIDSVISTGFLVYHLNYSKENTNNKIFKKLGYPQRFGFPVFIILNGSGKVIQTMSSEYLEAGGTGYDKNKVQLFLEMWTPHAIDPQIYGD